MVTVEEEEEDDDVPGMYNKSLFSYFIHLNIISKEKAQLGYWWNKERSTLHNMTSQQYLHQVMGSFLCCPDGVLWHVTF